MDDELPTWPRPYFVPGGSNADLFIVVYGHFAGIASMQFPRYRAEGLPSGFEMTCHSRRKEPGLFRSLETSGFWAIAAPRNRGVAAAAASAPECVVLQGCVPDPETLDYLRDLVGFVMCLYDAGGVAVLDTSSLRFWSYEAWRDDFYRPAAPVPRRHILVGTFPEGGRLFRCQTFGLKKFGRPDLCVRRAGLRYETALRRFLEQQAEYLALGGVIRPKQRVTGEGLPGHGLARSVPNPTDHSSKEPVLEFVWSESALAPRWWWFW